MPRSFAAAIALLTIGLLLPVAAQQPPAQPPPAQQQAPQPRPDDPPHETFFYKNGPLELEGYFFKPAGAGPFPLVVYNHGSRANQERLEWPVYYIARLVVPAGYALLVPERRGYGKSEGKTFTEDIGADERGQRFVDRLVLEAADVNAAVDYAKKTFPIDPKRIVMQGYSFGGIVTTLAAAKSTSLRAIVNQAPGALNWDKSAELRTALTAAAKKIRVPMICMAAENDLTTESARVICATAKAAGAAAEVRIYPPFTHPTNPNPRAPGHALFAPIGVDIWKQDLLDFLAKQAR